jgi:hypothetical protein
MLTIWYYYVSLLMLPVNFFINSWRTGISYQAKHFHMKNPLADASALNTLNLFTKQIGFIVVG